MNGSTAVPENSPPGGLRGARPGAGRPGIRRPRRWLTALTALTVLATVAAGVSVAGPAAAAAGPQQPPDPHQSSSHHSPGKPAAPKPPEQKKLDKLNPAKPEEVPAADPAKPAADPVPPARAAATLKARATGQSVPVPELTTDRSTTAANPDGTFTLSETLAPQRVKQGADWVPIDTTLSVNADGRLHTKATTADITVSDGGAGPLFTIGTGTSKVSVAWPLGPLPTPSVTGDKAVFHSVLPGVDLQLTAADETVRDVLVVKDAKAAANPALKTFHFGLSTTGLTVKTDTSGTLYATDAKGKMVFVGGAPQMWDSTTAPAPAAAKAASSTQAPVTTPADPAVAAPEGAHTATMGMTLNGSDVAITPDQAALTDSRTAFPVYYDPSISLGLTDKFTEIRSGQPTSSFYSNGVNGNGDWVRTGWDPGLADGVPIGKIRGMMSFDVYGPILALNEHSQNSGNYIDEYGTNVKSASLVFTAQYGQNCPSVPPFEIYRTGPIDLRPVTWATDGPGTSGAFGTQAIFLGTRSPNGCGFGAQMQIDDDIQQIKDAIQSGYNGGEGTATIGIRMGDPFESASYPYYWSWFHTETINGGVGTATLNVTYTAAPYINGLSTTPAPSKTDCGPVYGAGGPPSAADAGYIRKNIGNQVTLNSSAFDYTGDEPLQSQYRFYDVTPGESGGLSLPPNGSYGDANNPGTGTNSIGAGTAPLHSTTLHQSDGNLQDGHTYMFQGYAVDANDSSLNSTIASDSLECFFTIAFISPDAPHIQSVDLLPLGQNSAPGKYAGMSDAGFQITGTTGGVNIDHFDYVIDADSSKVGDANGGGHVQVSSYDSNNPNGNTAHATIPVPAGLTTMGDNTVYVRAVDVAGNESPVAQYDFYLPGNPNKVPTPGDVTGDGVPDVVAVTPDPATPGAKHLVVFPGNKDPNIMGAVNNSLEASPAAAAPDNTSWANTLVTHRGALTGVAVDDLFAYSTVSHTMSYYTNKNMFGQTGNSEMFARSQRVDITRPPCVPTTETGYCADYDQTDWSHVVQIVALGNAAGGAPGTFAGRTNLLTVETDGNHGAEVWMFSATGGDQLQNPVLVSKGSSFDWLNADLIAPGPTTSSGLPDLWARNRLTGTLYQFTNQAFNGIEYPTSLGGAYGSKVIGAEGSFTTSLDTALVSAGNPTAPDHSGNFTESGAPALWNVQPDGQLVLMPGTQGGAPVTDPKAQWSTSHTAWAAANHISSVNGASIGTAASSASLPNATASGQIMLGIDQVNGTQMCLDLSNGSTAPGTPVQSWSCNGTAPQVWSMYADGTIRWAPDPTQCVEVSSTPTDSNGTMPGSPVQINKCAAMVNGDIAANQRWIMRPSPGAAANKLTGWVNLYNPAAAKCLDDPYANANAQQMWIARCTDGNTASSANQAQEWLAPTSSGNWLQIEGEDLAGYTHEQATAPTSISCDAGCSSNGTAYMLAGTKVGDHFGVDYYVPIAGDYTVTPGMGTGPANAIVTTTVDQITLPTPVDTYYTNNGVTGWDFGVMHLTAGMHSFVFTVTGRNQASTGYHVSLDSLDLKPAHGIGPTVGKDFQTTNADFPILLAEPATFDYSWSDPGRYPIKTFTFDFGDGTTATQVSGITQHRYSATGTYTATVTATDTAGNTAQQVVPVVVTANGPPSMELTVASYGGVHYPVTAYGYCQGDYGSTPCDFTFDFGDGTPPVKQATANANHTYTAPGTYTITMTGTTQFGSSSKTSTITIGNTMPIALVQQRSGSSTTTGNRPMACFQAPFTGGETAIVTVMTNAAAPVTVWDMDGNSPSPVGGAVTDSSGHQLKMFAFYNVKADTNSSGDCFYTSFGSASISESQLTAAEYSGISGLDKTAAWHGSANTAFSSGATAITTNADDLLVGVVGTHGGAAPTWTTPPQSNALPDAAVGSDHLGQSWQALTATGAYSASGPSTGQWIAEAATFTPMAVPAFTASVTTGPASGPAPMAVTVDATATKGPNPITGYAFAFGDGASLATQASPTAAHTYTNPGTYTVTLTATDSTGATKTATTTVTVTAAASFKYIGRTGQYAGTVSGTNIKIHPPTAGAKAGDTLVVSLELNSANATSPGAYPSVVDSKGNYYSYSNTQTDGGSYETAQFTATKITALTSSDTITISFPTAAAQIATVDEFSGPSTENTYYGNFSAAGLPGHFSTVPTFDTTEMASELVFGTAGVESGNQATWDSDFTALPTVFLSGTSGMQLTTAYKTVTAEGNYSVGGTAGGIWMAGMVTLE